MIAALTNHLWQSTAFALAVALLVTLFRSNRAQVRFSLWFSASIKFLVPFAMLMYSNSRISEAKETLRAEMALGFERISNKVDHLAGEVATLKELMSIHMREHHDLK